MFKQIFILVLFLLPGPYNNCFPQVIEEWFRTYSGGFTPNLTNDFTIDSVGNSYLVGDVSRNSWESVNAIGTVKYNSSGVLQWANLYQGSSRRLDKAEAITVDKIGNVYVTGATQDLDSSDNYCTIKYNSEGNIIWVRKYQVFQGSRDFASDICLDNDGNVYVTGSTYFSSPNSINTIKYDSSGNQIWVAVYNDSLYPGKLAVSLAVDNFNNVYVTGEVADNFCTIKYNQNGQQQWVSFHNNNNLEDIPCDIKLDQNGNVYILGLSLVNWFHEFYTVVLKYDKDGNLVWSFRTDSTGKGSSPYYNATRSFRIDSENDVYFATRYNRSCSLIKLDSSGFMLWNSKYIGMPTYLEAIGRSIELDNKGYIYVSGEAFKPPGGGGFLTLKYNSAGVLQWVRNFHSYTNSGDEGCFNRIDHAGNVYIAGIAYNMFIETSFCVVKYSQSVGITNISSEIPDSYILHQNYPNPFNPVTVIRYSLIENRFTTLKVFDALGKIVSTLVNEKQNTGTYEVEFDGSDLASGVYYYNLSAGDFSETKRMLLLK